MNKDLTTSTKTQRRNYSSYLQRKFMRLMLNKILGNTDSGTPHLLSFLVNKQTRNWRSREPGSEHDLAVHVGHLESRWAGGEDRLAVESATQNHGFRERHGAVHFRKAVIIEGVYVERETARQWERLGCLPAGTVDHASRSDGWRHL